MPDDGVTRVEFHPLGCREDADEWIVGRPDTGDFLAIPQEGMLAIRLLRSGSTVPETRSRIRARTGRDMDVAGFVRALGAAGMVVSIDGRTVASKTAPPPTFPRIRPEHVRWALSPLLHGVLLALGAVGLVVAVLQPGVIPRWGDVLWSDRGTLVLLTQAMMAWLVLFGHEMAHLLTARAAGVPGWIRLGTRLQFLTMQTDVSGVWLSDRRTRMIVYFAGIELGMALYGACLAGMAIFGKNPLVAVLVLNGLLNVGYEFLVFMRTDVYFALQDLTGCRNLYGDASAYLRHLGARLIGRRPPNPLAGLRATERRVSRAYAVLLVVGTGGCLVLAYYVYTRVIWVLLYRAVVELGGSAGWPGVADGMVTLVVVGGVQVLWVKAWWTRHGAKVCRWMRRPLGAGRREHEALGGGS